MGQLPMSEVEKLAIFCLVQCVCSCEAVLRFTFAKRVVDTLDNLNTAAVAMAVLVTAAAAAVQLPDGHICCALPLHGDNANDIVHPRLLID